MRGIGYTLLVIAFLVLNIGTNVYLNDAAYSYYDVDPKLIEQGYIDKERVDERTLIFRDQWSTAAMVVSIATLVISAIYGRYLRENYPGAKLSWLLVGIFTLLSAFMTFIYSLGFLELGEL